MFTFRRDIADFRLEKNTRRCHISLADEGSIRAPRAACTNFQQIISIRRFSPRLFRLTYRHDNPGNAGCLETPIRRARSAPGRVDALEKSCFD
ncbi:MAG TPA: hypothetical protein VNR39_04590 [Pseudolabrys sp.]|nr:hypothetical protein [Pseudolabrys sp.]